MEVLLVEMETWARDGGPVPQCAHDAEEYMEWREPTGKSPHADRFEAHLNMFDIEAVALLGFMAWGEPITLPMMFVGLHDVGVDFAAQDRIMAAADAASERTCQEAS